jgi:hypothetical protein
MAAQKKLLPNFNPAFGGIILRALFMWQSEQINILSCVIQQVVFNVQMACAGCSGACTRILNKMEGRLRAKHYHHLSLASAAGHNRLCWTGRLLVVLIKHGLLQSHWCLRLVLDSDY